MPRNSKSAAKESIENFINSMAVARRLHKEALALQHGRNKPAQTMIWATRGDVERAADIESVAAREARDATLGYAEKHLKAMVQAGLPAVLQTRCERSLRLSEQTGADWCATQIQLEQWVGGAQSAVSKEPVKVDKSKEPRTQKEVDAHIQQLRDKIEFRGGFDGLVKACQYGNQKAITIARNVFSQAALVKGLGCSPAQIQRSKIWQTIRAQLSCLTQKGRHPRGRKIGMERAAAIVSTKQWKDNQEQTGTYAESTRQKMTPQERQLDQKADAILAAGKRLPG